MGYPKNVYEKARTIMNQRKQKAESIKTYRTTKVYENIPRIKEIDLELAQTGAGVVKAVIAEPTRCGEIVEKLKKKNLDLQEEKSLLLARSGLGANYLEAPYYCKDCKDTGYIKNERCNCYSRLLRQCAYQGFNNTPSLGEYGFENFLLEYYPKTPMSGTGIVPYDNAAKIKDYCMEYAFSFDEQSKSLLFMGGTGLGKTHLSLALARNIVEKGYGVMYESVQNLLSKIEKEKFSKDYNEKKALDTLEMALDCDLLIIDDLGSEHLTAFTRSVIYNIINTRIITKKPTVISTNLDLNALKTQYTDRIISRLVGEYDVFKFYGNDIRIKKKF